MKDEKFVILGGGITGLAAAWQLSKEFGERVVLIEKSQVEGGLASTVAVGGFNFDVGSHRIHENLDRSMFDLIQELSGAPLLKRERHGKILIQDRFLRFPPTIMDFGAVFGLRKTCSLLSSFLAARAGRLFQSAPKDNFEAYTVAKVGRVAYEMFYLPYIRKLYGQSPDRISSEPAVKRVRRNFLKNLRANLHRKQRYYYPKGGIGAIAQGLKKRLIENGGRIYSGTSVTALHIEKNRITSVVAEDSQGGRLEFPVFALIATVPMKLIYNMLRAALDPGMPDFGLTWRGLRILHLVLPGAPESNVETYYFPSDEVFFGRVSEPAKYQAADSGAKRAFTVEIPCSKGDEIWNAGEAELAERCLRDLIRFGIALPCSLSETQFVSLTLDGIYPVYRCGWRTEHSRIINLFSSVENLTVAGRTALFLHCNIDHCLEMALEVAETAKRGSAPAAELRAMQERFLENYYVRE